jgi:putative protease
MVQGNLEAVTSEDRLHRALTARNTASRPARRSWGILDETGRVFPLSQDGTGRTRIANAVELCLVDHIPELAQSGIGVLSIDARGRTPDYARDVVALYRKAVQMATGTAEKWEAGMQSIKEELKKRSRGGITQGRFLTDLGG